MNIVRHGIILNVENYDACVVFYRSVFDLPLMHQSTEGSFRLSCLEYGSCYLMIETGGTASPSGKSPSECPTKLRFNVADLKDSLVKLKSFGIDAEITKNDWGSTINIFDPDGNRIGIRDEVSFGGKTSASQAN